MAQASARYARLIRICRLRGCSREDARELVQEAHLRLYEYQRSATVKSEDSLLRRIVINLTINYFHRTLSSPFSFESIDERRRHRELIDPAPGPERVLTAERELDSIVRHLTAANERIGRIFLAHRMGYSHQEIGTLFGIMPRTVERHVAATSMLIEIMRADLARGTPSS